jgi:hypothetical protein
MLRLILPLALGTVLSGAVVAFATESPYKPVRHHRAIDHAGFVGFPGPSETPTASLSQKARARQSLHEELSLN